MKVTGFRVFEVVLQCVPCGVVEVINFFEVVLMWCYSVHSKK